MPVAEPLLDPTRVDPGPLRPGRTEPTLPDMPEDIELDPTYNGSDIPPMFGKCPVCGKPLRPRDRFTGEPKAPPVGEGVFSRAKCDKCGAIIEYVGKGEWVAVNIDNALPDQAPTPGQIW